MPGNCAVDGCNQLVINKKELEKEVSYCYMHRKVVNNLFGAPNEYTFTEDVGVLDCAYSNPSDYSVVTEGKFWNL